MVWRVTDRSDHPFATAVLERAHGVTVTSATLQDQAPRRTNSDDSVSSAGVTTHDGWQSALALTGAIHLNHQT